MRMLGTREAQSWTAPKTTPASTSTSKRFILQKASGCGVPPRVWRRKTGLLGKAVRRQALEQTPYRTAACELEIVRTASGLGDRGLQEKRITRSMLNFIHDMEKFDA